MSLVPTVPPCKHLWGAGQVLSSRTFWRFCTRSSRSRNSAFCFFASSWHTKKRPISTKATVCVNLHILTGFQYSSSLNIPRAARVCFNKKRFPDFTEWLVVPKLKGAYPSKNVWNKRMSVCRSDFEGLCDILLLLSSSSQSLQISTLIWCRLESRTWINMTSKQVSITSRKEQIFKNINK